MRHLKQFTKRNNPFSAGNRAFGNGRPYFFGGGGEVMTVEKEKTGFVIKIGGTTFIVNAMPSEDSKLTQVELVKALIAKEAMALNADVA